MNVFALGSATLVSMCALGCIAPSVLARDQRAVVSAVGEPSWNGAQPGDLQGWFESTHIEGDAANSFLRIEYFFAADGTYSGAALAYGSAGPEFQTLMGSWHFVGDELDLGDGNTAHVRAAPGWLKLESDGGSVVLRRVEVR